MQRIFSTFPDSWPGFGLLLLRVAGSAPLFVIGLSRLWAEPADAALWIRILSCVSGALMLVGFWTPFAATLQVLVEGIFAVGGATFEWTHLIHALIGLSLMMLGPGYWSIDARLYGRKRIDLGHPQRRTSEREPRDP
jgi:putative oxidoreductase